MGDKNKFLKWFANASLGAAMSESPSVMTASGWRQNENGEHVQDQTNNEGVQELRNNLSIISGLSPTHPINAAFAGIAPLFKWKAFLPKGTETTVYRQGGLDMIDDALQSGIIKPQSEANYAAKVAADKASGKKLILRKKFNNIMFNREYPFYGNPMLFENTSNKGVFVGNMNNSSAVWKQNFHKNHKNIFEPFINEIRQAPLSEFDIYKRAPLNFGWFKNPHKTTFIPIKSLYEFNQNVNYEK